MDDKAIDSSQATSQQSLQAKRSIKVWAEMKRAALLCSRIKLSTAQQNQDKKTPFLLGQQSGYSDENVDILCKPPARLFLSAILCVDATV